GGPPLWASGPGRTRPARGEVRRVEFTTASPGVSAWCHWAGIEAQVHALKPSTVTLRHDPAQRNFSGTTANVARLALDVGHLTPGDKIRVDLDGQKVENILWPPQGTIVRLKREGERWSVTDPPPPALKGPHRY